MMNKLLCAPSDGVAILYTFIALLIMGGLTFFLVFRVKRERIRFMESMPGKGAMTLDELKKYIDKVCPMLTKRATLYFFQVDIRDYDILHKSIGEAQYLELLKDFYSIWAKLLPWGIRIAKLADDKILIVIRQNNSFDTEEIAQAIIDHAQSQTRIAETMKIEVAVNVAVGLFPSIGENSEEIINNLELAMVASRRNGKNKYVVYSPTIGSSESEEYRYYQEIREAMKNKEFNLYYQPIIESNSLEVCSAEALIRWKHKTMGVLPPSSFLHIMEKTGDINWVGFWCFEQMVKQSIIWRANYPQQQFVYVHNLSERQLQNAQLADELRKIIKKNHCNPADFVMELDMRLYFSSEVARRNIDALAADTFKISLDGFGTEFNDLSAIENLPINIIKIDGSFWRKAGESSITHNILDTLISFTREKKIMLIAHGVENADEFNMLRQLGINYMEGYLFSAPKDPREFISEVLMTPWATVLQQ